VALGDLPWVTSGPFGLAAAKHSRSRQTSAEQRCGEGFGDLGEGSDGGSGAAAAHPRLGTVGEVGREERTTVIGNEIIGAETARAGQGEEQIPEIAVRRAGVVKAILRTPEPASVKAKGVCGPPVLTKP